MPLWAIRRREKSLASTRNRTPTTRPSSPSSNSYLDWGTMYKYKIIKSYIFAVFPTCGPYFYFCNYMPPFFNCYWYTYGFERYWLAHLWHFLTYLPWPDGTQHRLATVKVIETGLQFFANKLAYIILFIQWGFLFASRADLSLQQFGVRWNISHSKLF
jgi:hypothetical protein